MIEEFVWNVNLNLLDQLIKSCVKPNLIFRTVEPTNGFLVGNVPPIFWTMIIFTLTSYLTLINKKIPIFFTNREKIYQAEMPRVSSFLLARRLELTIVWFMTPLIDASSAYQDTLSIKKESANKIQLELSKTAWGTPLLPIVSLALKVIIWKIKSVARSTILKIVWSTNKMLKLPFVPDVLMITIYQLKICAQKELTCQTFLCAWSSRSNLKSVNNACKDTLPLKMASDV